MFEWDEEKNRKNIEKDGISFEQAQGIFAGPVVSFVDARDYGEERVISLGMLEGIAIIVVVHTDRNGKTRINSARPSSAKEKEIYHDAIQRADDA